MIVTIMQLGCFCNSFPFAVGWAFGFCCKLLQFVWIWDDLPLFLDPKVKPTITLEKVVDAVFRAVGFDLFSVRNRFDFASSVTFEPRFPPITPLLAVTVAKKGVNVMPSSVWVPFGHVEPGRLRRFLGCPALKCSMCAPFRVFAFERSSKPFSPNGQAIQPVRELSIETFSVCGRSGGTRMGHRTSRIHVYRVLLLV